MTKFHQGSAVADFISSCQKPRNIVFSMSVCLSFSKSVYSFHITCLGIVILKQCTLSFVIMASEVHSYIVLLLNLF